MKCLNDYYDTTQMLRLVDISDVDVNINWVKGIYGRHCIGEFTVLTCQGINVPIKWSYHFIRFQEGRILQVLALGSHETSVRRPGSVDKMAQAAAQTHSAARFLEPLPVFVKHG